MSQNSDYRNTVFLPQTSFPMRADLPRKEPQILAQWEEMKLWERMRAENRGARKFILHDGPPYANGPIHIGTALNKVLKDIINRSRQMSGLDAYYVRDGTATACPSNGKSRRNTVPPGATKTRCRF